MAGLFLWIVGRLLPVPLIKFFPQHRHVPRRVDPEANLFSVDAENGHSHAIADPHHAAYSPGQYQHA
jgi:hypothetical protein